MAILAFRRLRTLLSLHWHSIEAYCFEVFPCLKPFKDHDDKGGLLLNTMDLSLDVPRVFTIRFINFTLRDLYLQRSSK